MYAYIANYCNSSKNDGIHCPKCKKHGKKCKCVYNGQLSPTAAQRPRSARVLSPFIGRYE